MAVTRECSPRAWTTRAPTIRVGCRNDCRLRDAGKLFMKSLSIVSLVAAMGVAWAAIAADNPQVIQLWPGNVPDESETIGPERVRMSPKLDRKQVEVTEQTTLITAVTNPTITVYRPVKEKNTGTAMLICPGG